MTSATGWSRAALTVGVGLAILQQVTGINTVIYYAPTIVEFTGIDSSSSAILAAVGVGIVNVGMTLVAIRLSIASAAASCCSAAPR